jgi:hypothetical protein
MIFRSDGNTKEIVTKWRKKGRRIEYWIPVHRQKGMPDLICPILGVTWLVEVKKPGESLSDDQEAWHKAWIAAGGGPIAVVHSYEELCTATGVEP